MIPSIREAFNRSFSAEKYETFLKDLHSAHPGAIDFRVAETPIFIPKDFAKKMISTCEAIVDLIIDPSFLAISDRAIPPDEKVPGETPICHMIAFDFGICENAGGGLEPQLIEMQGFPTLFGFQVYYPDLIKKHFDVPATFTQYLGGKTKESFLADFRDVILGSMQPESVILLEIKPHEQKTRIDFYCTEDYLGIRPVCITDLIVEDKDVYYMRDGIKTRVRRIYNRVIFDELREKQSELGVFADITKPLNVEWIPHPNWFYRISKFTIPFIHHPYVPETFFLNEVKQLPSDLENYVLKPLFSFAGQGVIIDLTAKDIEEVTDPENWILQKKVKYAAVVETPGDPAKAEIRMMYLWKPGESRPKPVINLARLSKGKMIGVRYNKDKDWVGGSVALFEP